MGYSEILCTICGVSFNIARIRREGERKSAAWGYYKHSDSYVRAEEPDAFEYCGNKSGCTYYSRELDDGIYRSPWQETEKDEHAGDENADENAGLVSEYQDGIDENVEHIAGPGCNSDNGYSGWSISIEEMQGCTTFQCLVRKRKDWKPASDDQDFEKDSNFPMYLSGLCDAMPDRELGNIDVMHPMRHDMQSHAPDDICWGGGSDENDHFYSMPFHPSCLEIYKRASRTWFDGKQDHMQGLLNWWRTGASDETFAGNSPSTGRCGGIGRLHQQWWCHETDTEYIAANPLFIPNLAKVIADATTPHPIDGNSGAFDLPANTNFSPCPGDLFATLPAELRLNILTELSSEDICNLRVVSRSFRQLPLSLYHDMLMKNMDFFWEAWPAKDQTPYPFLATTTAEKIQNGPSVPRDPVPVPNQLDLTRTNWYKLYYGLRRGIRNGELKGLANRSRIWEDCESILESIVEHWDEWEEERESRKANS